MGVEHSGEGIFGCARKCNALQTNLELWCSVKYKM